MPIRVRGVGGCGWWRWCGLVDGVGVVGVVWCGVGGVGGVWLMLCLTRLLLHLLHLTLMLCLLHLMLFLLGQTSEFTEVKQRTDRISNAYQQHLLRTLSAMKKLNNVQHVFVFFWCIETIPKHTEARWRRVPQHSTAQA